MNGYAADYSEKRIYDNRRNRRRVLRRNIRIFATSFILIMVCSAMFFTMKVKAQNSDASASQKYYKSITITAGDTLWNYAERYADEEHYEDYQEYVDEVLRMNGLMNDEITVGQCLIIPYYSSN